MKLWKQDPKGFRNLDIMTKIDRYRNYIKQVIQDHARHQLAYDQIEVQSIFDPEGDHYQLVQAGWHNKQRQYGCLMHLDIKDEKIWIQYDGTEVGVANELVDLGTPKSDIVLFYSANICAANYGVCSGSGFQPQVLAEREIRDH